MSVIVFKKRRIPVRISGTDDVAVFVPGLCKLAAQSIRCLCETIQYVVDKLSCAAVGIREAGPVADGIPGGGPDAAIGIDGFYDSVESIVFKSSGIAVFVGH